MSIIEQLEAKSREAHPGKAGGVDIFIRVLTGQELADYFDNFDDVTNLAKVKPHIIRRAMVVRALCDADGTRLFADDATPKFSEKIMLEIFDQAADLNRLHPDALADTTPEVTLEAKNDSAGAAPDNGNESPASLDRQWPKHAGG